MRTDDLSPADQAAIAAYEQACAVAAARGAPVAIPERPPATSAAVAAVTPPALPIPPALPRSKRPKRKLRGRIRVAERERRGEDGEAYDGRDGNGAKLATLELQRQAVQLRVAGMAERDIADLMCLSQARVSQLLKSAKRAMQIETGHIAIDAELRHLETLRDRCYTLLDAKMYLVSAGAVVTDTVDDPQTGRPLLDPRTNEPIRVRLTDSAATLAVVDRLARISESIARLFGMNAPKRVAHTVTTQPGASPVGVFETKEEFEESMRAVVREETARSRRVPAITGPVVDVEPRTVGGSSHATPQE